MPVEEFDLARILWPVEPAAFFRDTWERQPLHVARQDATYYRGLFALRDVDAVLAFTRPKFSEPEAFKPNEPSVQNFIQGELADDSSAVVVYPDLLEVHKTFARGKTLIVNGMHQRWPAVAALCRRLVEFFGCVVHANLYLTPPGAQGFTAHFDTHEVFVLQIEGTKHWRFYAPARHLPLPDDWMPLAPEELGPPTQEAFLEAGDMLYMPRGHVHEAFTLDRASLHLTVGVRVFRWIDLLRQALDNAARDDCRYRELLPLGLLTDGRVPSPAKHCRELLQDLAENARADAAVAGLAAKFLQKLPSLPDAFFTEDGAESLTADTLLERAPGVVLQVFPVGEGRVALYYPGGRLEGPPKIAAALHFIVRTPRFAAAALPDNLTVEGKLVLLRQLIRNRVLRLANETPPTVS